MIGEDDDYQDDEDDEEDHYDDGEEGERTPPALPDDGTAHDVTVIYNEGEEHYVFVPNNAEALAVMHVISPEGFEGMAIGSESPRIPWIAAYFMCRTLEDQHEMTVREKIVNEA